MGFHVLSDGASRGRIVPPAMRARGFPVFGPVERVPRASKLPAARRDFSPHTRPMRQWACVFALLLGLMGSGYTASTRVRIPVPIERRLDSWRRDGDLVQTIDWWRA